MLQISYGLYQWMLYIQGVPKKIGNSEDWKLRKMKLSMQDQKALNKNIINPDFQNSTQKPIFGQKPFFSFYCNNSLNIDRNFSIIGIYDLYRLL